MSVSTILLIAAVVVFVIAALLAFGTISSGISIIGLVALGSACFAAGHLPI